MEGATCARRSELRPYSFLAASIERKVRAASRARLRDRGRSTGRTIYKKYSQVWVLVLLKSQVRPTILENGSALFCVVMHKFCTLILPRNVNWVFAAAVPEQPFHRINEAPGVGAPPATFAQAPL